MTHQPDPHDRDSDDEPPSVSTLRRVLRLLAAVHATDPDRYDRRRTSDGGVIDAGINIRNVDPQPQRDRFPDPHVDTRDVEGGTDVVVDLSGTDPDALTVTTDPVAESVVIDAPAYRRRRLPLPAGESVADTRMHNGILEIRLREAHADEGGEASE